MAQRSGIAAQFGLAAETTYGTRVAPGRFLEFKSESLGVDIDRIESDALRLNQRILRGDHWVAGRKDVSGDIEMDIPNKGFGLLLQGMLGAIATTVDGTGKKHSATLGDPYGVSYSIQFGVPDSSGTVRPFDFLGCMITAWEISMAVNGILNAKLSFNGRDLDTAQSLATSSDPALTELFVFQRGVVSLGGSGIKVKDWSLSGNLGLDVARYFQQSGGDLKAAPIQASMVELGGTLTMEFEDLTQLNRYLNGAHAALQITATTVATYDTAKPYKLDINAPSIRVDGDVPNVSGPGITELTLPFKVVDTTGTPITIDYYTSDAAP